MSFGLRENEDLPQSESVTVTWSSPEITDIAAAFGSSDPAPNWLTATTSKSFREATITLTPTTSSMTEGTYDAVLNVIARDALSQDLVTQQLSIRYDIKSSGADKRAVPDQILHFGQSIILNGANVAWSEHNSNWFNQEIGTVDVTGAPRTNIKAFKDHFRTIAAAGGNSARIWLHTGATSTPVIENSGIVTGLSRDLTDAQVVGQLKEILDAAWDEGILVTFNLFSFNMVCDAYQPMAAKRMLETQLQTYIDNALTPMVSGVKDHPAMFAWDIFNEAEGMSQANYFCPSTETVSTETAQRVVNQIAAAVHRLDPNVKVTTSVHTDLFDRYSNTVLTALPNAHPGGILDFYALHWFNTGWQVSPFETPAATFKADRPVMAGEYDVEDTGTNGPSADKSLKLLLDNGYEGGWPWSLSTGNTALISSAITTAAPLSGPLDKAAIEACLQTKPDTCYTP